MKELAQAGKISGETAVWKNGMAQWVELAQIPELSEADSSTPPPTPPTAGASSPALKLGAGRKFDSVNAQDTAPSRGMEIPEMLAATPEGVSAAKSAKAKEPRIVAQSKVGFFESFGLGSFESAFFAVTLILGGIACAVMRDYWHAIVIGVGCLWMFAAGIALTVRAFIKHWAWGLAYLLIPFAALVYIIVDLKNAYKAVVLYFVGLAACIATIQSPSFRESPLWEYFEEYQQMIEEEIQRQQQEIEESRNQRTDQYELE